MSEAGNVPRELPRTPILQGQKALIVGVANDRSIAWDAPRRCIGLARRSQ